MYIAITNPSLVICASHECIGLFLRLIAKPWFLIRLKLPSMTASPFFSASRTRLYRSMFFMLILSPSITTFRGTLFAALCITCFSSTRPHILGLSITNSVIRCPLCSSLNIGPGSLLLKLRNDKSEGSLLLSTSCSKVVLELSIEVTRVIQF